MKKHQLDSISVKSPCSESWDEMSGNDKIRFCSHCAKSVHNFSAMTLSEINKLVEKSNGKLCVKYVKTPQGKLITAATKTSKIKRQSAIAASVLASSLALWTAVYAQGKPVLKSEVAQTQIDDSKKTTSSQNDSTLYGVVMDSSGAVIPNARVTLRDTKKDSVQFVQSNSEGFYQFKNIEPAIYQIEVESPGFIKAIWKDVEIFSGTRMEKNISLEVGEATVGILIIADSPVETPVTKTSDKIDLIKSIPVFEIQKPRKGKNRK